MDKKLYSYIAIFAGLVSFAYWSLFAGNAMYNFHEYSDLAQFSYNMWVYLHYPALAHGLQILVYCTHLSPDMALLLPLYYIAPSSLTLLVFQALLLSATGVAIFFIAKDLLNRPLLALGLSFAFLLNPGIFGMLVFDFHAEALIIPFYLLTFYFYMKSNRKAFYVSAILLLGTIEEGPFMAFTLALALFLYDYRFTHDAHERRKRLIMSGSLMALSILTFAFYSFTVSYLTAAYANGQYIGLAPILQLLPLAQSQIAILSTPFTQLSSELGPMLGYTIYAMLIIFFSFGIAWIFDPLSTIILLSPYIVEFFVVGNENFAFIFNQYFGFVLGGTIVAAILGIMNVKNDRGAIVKEVVENNEKHRELILKKIIPYSMVVVVIILLVFFPTFMLSRNVNNFAQDFLFQISPQQHALDTQLYSVMNYLPANASLLTTYFIVPHIVDRKDIELIYPTGYYFQPDYILIDFNLNVSLNAYSYGQPQYFEAFWANQSKNYTVFAENGTGWINSAILLKRNTTTVK